MSHDSGWKMVWYWPLVGIGIDCNGNLVQALGKRETGDLKMVESFCLEVSVMSEAVFQGLGLLRSAFCSLFNLIRK